MAKGRGVGGTWAFRLTPATRGRRSASPTTRPPWSGVRGVVQSARFIDVVPWRPGGLAAIASFVATAFRLVRFPTHIFAPVRGHPAAVGFSASFALDLKFALLLVLFGLHRIGRKMRWTVPTWISAPGLGSLWWRFASVFDGSLPLPTHKSTVHFSERMN